MNEFVNSPLDGITVVDFTTLAPGPMASLMLANAGAQVIKIERPGIGDEMRIYDRAFGDNGVTFALLNSAKRSFAADLKNSGDLDEVKQLIANADVVLEQFRPGVMAKLGLDYDSVCTDNPRLVYCSITGFGQTGPKSSVAAHDLNYVADAGMLTIGRHEDGKPAIPQLLAADIAGGSYPAVMNILLALHLRNQTGKGTYIDISMTDCLFPLMFWGLGLGWGAGQWPARGNHLLSGNSPRYQVYVTSDQRILAVAALEDRFWKVFCETIGYTPDPELEVSDPTQMIREIEHIVRRKDAAHWRRQFQDKDACALIANTLDEAVQDPHYRLRGIFNRKITTDNGAEVNALPLPICENLLDKQRTAQPVPALGEYNKEDKLK